MQSGGAADYQRISAAARIPNRSPLFDEAVACGVAVQAGSLNDDEMRDLPFPDVAPGMLGNESVGGEMTRLAGRRAVDPASALQLFLTNPESQPAANT